MYTRILVPLDGSRNSECSLSHVQNIAKSNPGSEVILILRHEEIIPSDVGYINESKANQMVKKIERDDKAIERKINIYLTGIANKLTKEGITVESTVIHPEASKNTAEAIIEYAEANNVDLIVITTHGRSGISKWAFGSVADKVAHYSRIPVLIITPPECRI